MSQWYKGKAEIEIGGEEMEVTYHYLPSGNALDPGEVHYKAIHMVTYHSTITDAPEGLKLGAVVHATLTKRLFNVTDILEEVAGGQAELWSLVADKLSDLLTTYEPVAGMEVDE